MEVIDGQDGTEPRRIHLGFGLIHLGQRHTWPILGMAEMLVVLDEMISLLAEVIHLGYVITEMFGSGSR